jgi:hypothetical protein
MILGSDSEQGNSFCQLLVILTNLEKEKYEKLIPDSIY